jgi:hypothetical protein
LNSILSISSIAIDHYLKEQTERMVIKKYSESATKEIRSGKNVIFSVLRAAKKYRA